MVTAAVNSIRQLEPAAAGSRLQSRELDLRQVRTTLLHGRAVSHQLHAAYCCRHSTAHGAEDSAVCAVTMNGGRLAMTKGETELEMIPYVEGGELLMLWQLHREGLGRAVEITTGEISAESVPSYALSAPCQHPASSHSLQGTAASHRLASD